MYESQGRKPSRGWIRGPGLVRLVVPLLIVMSWPAAAQLNQRTIGSLGSSDRLKTERQLEHVDELARRHLGQRVRARSKGDLSILQRLLDERFVRKDDVYGQQCLGVALGSILASELPLSWVVVDDDFGHSRALRYRQEQELFFPVTMISKRIKTNQPVDLRDLYAKIEQSVKKLQRRSY